MNCFDCACVFGCFGLGWVWYFGVCGLWGCLRLLILASVFCLGVDSSICVPCLVVFGSWLCEVVFLCFGLCFRLLFCVVC